MTGPVAATLAMALGFVAVHVFVGRLTFLDVVPRSRWLSFAGGVAVGYVFLHIMPELGAHAAAFSAGTGYATPVAEAAVYTLALAGLVLFYGAERAIIVSRGMRRAKEGRDRPERGMFRLHIGASALLIFVIAYLLNHREDATVPGLALYFVAMALHFITADYGVRCHHPELYDRQGRWILAAATLAGWGAGVAVALPQVAIGGLFAFIGGAIVLVVLKEELPEERKSYFLPFVGGAVLYAILAAGELYLVA
ncbi:hypothetical protein [Pelagerythrobacter rhizovicinus]|uniref:Uncharacterized protein n=1 Tax=Pelagerythrobacter rhizovicinus TaxID=2268576 RepID=A0A4Q2KK38_9SPHN|nr:hypothetical protein [Pelagerythrobacter rhizovicinus]RXZ65625.1 hypothetical protein ETX26_02470 [Pelagerythrobacter rhizovicinus]